MTRQEICAAIRDRVGRACPDDVLAMLANLIEEVENNKFNYQSADVDDAARSLVTTIMGKQIRSELRVVK